MPHPPLRRFSPVVDRRQAGGFRGGFHDRFFQPGSSSVFGIVSAPTRIHVQGRNPVNALHTGGKFAGGVLDEFTRREYNPTIP